jgi:hypothetical protein
VAYVVILTKQCGLLKNGQKIRGETFLLLLVGIDYSIPFKKIAALVAIFI